MYRSQTAALRVALLALAAALLAAPAAAQDTTRKGVTIGLTYQPGTKTGIAVLPVAGVYGDSVAAIVQRDLDYSDRFSVVPLQAAADGGSFRAGPSGRLNYALFTKLGAQGIVQLTPTAAGLHVALHDAGRGAVVDVGDVPLPAAGLGRDWRLAVHGISDQVEQWITGQRGIAATRVVYARGTAIHVVDSDGAEDIAIPTAPNAMSPAWNPTGTMITYSTYGVQSRIHVHDLRTGRTRTLNATPGFANLTPVFTPDGSAIVYSHASENGSDLYRYSLATGEVRRISAGHGTDNASPSFSPDGLRIAFTSGRSGHPEIYIMDADGTNAELLTSFDFGDQNYRSDPDWSPDGRLVAFQSRFSGTFQVMTISLRDRSTKVLTSEGGNEQPSWAPDSRHLVFTSTRTGTRQLWVMDAESGRMRQLTHAAGSRLAAWSARLVGGAGSGGTQ